MTNWKQFLTEEVLKSVGMDLKIYCVFLPLSNAKAAVSVIPLCLAASFNNRNDM